MFYNSYIIIKVIVFYNSCIGSRVCNIIAVSESRLFYNSCIEIKAVYFMIFVSDQNRVL